MRSAMRRGRGSPGLQLALLLLLACGSATAATPDAEGPQHVAAPDWRDQVIYFLMIDRFDDGDRRNNDQGAHEFDPGDSAKYSGGDLRGIERRLDYVRGLGATAIWITPPVANQWWNPRSHYGGYHGYWAEDFTRLDAHVGTLADYQRLARKIHGAGMYLVQDVVVNHTGDYFGYDGGWTASDPAAHFSRRGDSLGRLAPTAWPFTLNDANDPLQRDAAIYHWTPVVGDFDDPRQEQTFQLADLDDLNTENPVVRRALRQAYGDWIRKVGVDAFRIDTAFYVPPDYFRDFMDADDPAAPGMRDVAKAVGQGEFFAFGEGFATERPYSDKQSRKIDGYLRDARGRTLLPGMLNFPLYGAITDVFARGRPTAELGYRIEAMMRLHAQPALLPTFVDNHDVERFLRGGNETGLRQALLLMMTLPGIPTIYYGTEQGFTEQRGAMFKAGIGAGGRDHFDTHAPLYTFLQRAIALRREHRLFSRGQQTVLRTDRSGPGVLAYRMTSGAQSAIVVFNSSDRAQLLDRLDTGLAAGTALDGLFGIDAVPAAATVGERGTLTRVLPPHAGWVWLAGESAPVVAAPGSEALLSIDPLPAGVATGDFSVSGRGPRSTALSLVVDGDLAAATPVRTDARGRWRVDLPTANFVDAAVTHRLVAWSPASNAASAPREFRIERAWSVLAAVDDPAGDDRGPRGAYTYPTDASWRDRHPADLRRVAVSGSGGALRIDVQLQDLIAAWRPDNGFDHLALTVFIAVPGQTGAARVMPLQHGDLPEGMRWNYRVRVHGWSNALFSAAGASASREGQAVSPAANLAVDAARRTISLRLPAQSLGRPGSLSGVRVLVTTWDYDGGYRALTPVAGSGSFGGGDGARDPLLMDASAVIVLP
jgi:glycosidase